MRTLVVCNIMSLDGHYDGPGRDVMVMPMDESFDAYNVERMRAAGTVLLGANAYRGFRSFWPDVAADATQSADNREISRLWATLPKVVISDTVTKDETDLWRDTTTIVRRAEAHERVAELKRGEGREILVFGSRVTWNDLLRAGLVDELHLMVGPVVLGGGTPVFGGQPAPSLRLLSARTFEDSSNVVLRYSTHGGGFVR